MDAIDCVRRPARGKLSPMSVEQNITQRLVVRGRVQGVGFRYHFTRAARGLKLSGWVRNRTDGTVEAIVSGPQHAVDKITAWARRGPPSAAVEHVEVSAADGTFEGFHTAPTE
jgi:acylphosphatase